MGAHATTACFRLLHTCVADAHRHAWPRTIVRLRVIRCVRSRGWYRQLSGSQSAFWWLHIYRISCKDYTVTLCARVSSLHVYLINRFASLPPRRPLGDAASPAMRSLGTTHDLIAITPAAPLPHLLYYTCEGSYIASRYGDLRLVIHTATDIIFFGSHSWWCTIQYKELPTVVISYAIHLGDAHRELFREIVHSCFDIGRLLRWLGIPIKFNWKCNWYLYWI